jgi:hypothetical protein
MRNPMALLAVGLLVALAPAAQAALNGSMPYQASLPYQPGLGKDTGNFTLLSGALTATLPDVKGPYGLFNATAARVTGLTRVCTGNLLPGQPLCLTSAGGGLSITVSAGGSFGIRFPKATSSTVKADHVLGLLVDFEGKTDLNSFGLARTLVAPAINGELAFTTLPDLPATTGVPDTDRDAGGMVALDAKTTLRILDAGVEQRTVSGKQDPVLFQGHPAIAPVQAGIFVLPFEDGSTANLKPATAAAAERGLDLTRITGLGNDLNSASKSGSAGAPSSVPRLDLGVLQPLVARILDGALLRLPTQATSGSSAFKQLALVRFDEFSVQGGASAAQVTGRGPLQVQGGQVRGAQALVGFAYFEMPWWSYLLWGLALAAFITRLVLNAPKGHPRWDRLRWVGWVANPLLFLLFLFLWDIEVHRVLGVSLLSGGVPGEAMLGLLAFEMGPLLFVFFAVVTPLRILFSNGARLAGQGRFIGVPTALAYVLGYFLGATLLLAYLNYALQAAAGAI